MSRMSTCVLIMDMYCKLGCAISNFYDNDSYVEVLVLRNYSLSLSCL